MPRAVSVMTCTVMPPLVCEDSGLLTLWPVALSSLPVSWKYLVGPTTGVCLLKSHLGAQCLLLAPEGLGTEVQGPKEAADLSPGLF